jgi:hypothetical protein
MKTGFKRILAALAMLFGSALLLASVRAQSSFTHSNNLIPNSVTALSVATGGTLNFAPALLSNGTSCPEEAKETGDAESPELNRQWVNVTAAKTCDDHTGGETEYKDDKGDSCTGPVDGLSEAVVMGIRIAKVSGECDSSEAGKPSQKARYVFTVIQTGPFGAFKMSWLTDSGSTYSSSGTLKDGSAQILP